MCCLFMAHSEAFPWIVVCLGSFLDFTKELTTLFFSVISIINLFFFEVYFIDYAITVVPLFSPLYSPRPCTPAPTSIPPLSLCLQVVHISSLASPFPILFLTSPCLFCTSLFFYASLPQILLCSLGLPWNWMPQVSNQFIFLHSGPVF